MTTIRTSLTAPGDGGTTLSVSIELIVDEESVDESGREAARLITRFLEAYGAEAAA